MKYKIITPNITMQAKDPRPAQFARIVSLLSAVLFLGFAIYNLISGSLMLISFLIAAAILIVEFDILPIFFLHNPLFRGLGYVLLAIISFSFSNIIPVIGIGIGGLSYIIYNYI